MFTSEEPTRFALSCSGSRAMAGACALGCMCFEDGSLLDRRGTELAAGGGFSAGLAGGNHPYCHQMMIMPLPSCWCCLPAGVLDADYLDSRRDENGTSYLAASTAGGVWVTVANSPTEQRTRHAG